MTVFIVVKQIDQGQIAGVFSSQSKASRYIEDNPYSGFMLSEHIVDNMSTKPTSKQQKEHSKDE